MALTRIPGSFLDSVSNVTFANITATSNLTAGNANLGNLASANFFVGNGSLLTGLPAGYSDSNVATYLETYSGNLSANIVTANIFDGDGASISNVDALTLNGFSSTSFATSSQGSLADTALQPADLTGYATETYVGNAIADLVNSAPSALDTLNELANALGNDASFSTSITNSLANKLDSAAFTYANITGAPTLGNLSTIDKDGNASNILYGNGVFASAPALYGDSNVASYLPTYAGNISANIVTANYFSGNGSNLSAIAGANVTGQVANSLVAGTVYTNAQPNITSLGVLTGLEISGNITPTSNVTYDLGNNTNRFRDLYLSGNTLELGGGTITINGNSMVLTNPAGGSFVVDGSNAAYASIASYVTEGIQANITQLGTLSNLTVTGNASAGNILTDNLLYANGDPYQFSSDLANLTDVVLTSAADGDVLSYDTASGKWVNTVPASGGASGGESTITSVDTFTGDGAETVFTLSVTPGSINQTFINYNGALQLRSAYTLSGAEITFSEAPANGSLIEVTTQMGVTSGSGNLTVRNYVADGVQVTYAVSSGVNATNILVTENGLVQTPITDYTVSAGVLTFTDAPGFGVKIQVRELGVAVSTITPVGSNTQVLFNDAGSFGNSAGFTYNKTTATLSANNIISGNILPKANVTYNLGSPTLSWKDLYLSGNTIHLGGAQISVDNTSGAVSLTPAATVSNPTPAPQVISSPRYISMVKTGNITTPDTGTSRYYPPKDVTISNVLASLSTASTSNLQFTINKNGSNTGAYTISANAYQLTKTVASISLTTSDYLTVDILTGEGAAELRLDLEYSDA